MRGSRPHRICRLCLSTGCRLDDILEESGNDEFVVKRAVEDLLQLVVIKEDVFPWLVCSLCLEKLREFYFFKRRCVESQEVYDSRIRGNIDIPVKSEEGNAVENPLQLDAFKNINIDHSNQLVAEGLSLDSKVAVKCEEDGSTWESTDVDSHNPNDCNSFEVSQSATGHESDFDIPIKTEEDNAVEDPLQHDACKYMGSDHSSLPSSEDLNIDSNVSVKSEESEEDDVQGKGPFSIEHDLSSKLYTGDVSILDAEVESSGNKQHGTGCGVVNKSQDTDFQPDDVARSPSSHVVAEESDTVSNPAGESGGADASRRRPKISMRGSVRGRSRGRGGSRSCLGRRKVREKFICVECGASFVSKLNLSTHIRAHLSRNENTCAAKGGGLGQEDDPGTYFPLPNYEELSCTSRDLGLQGFLCDHCGKEYSRKTELIRHIRSVHLKVCAVESTAPRKTFSSQKRSRAFTERFRGEIVHSEERLFKCERCLKAFKTNGELSRHSLVHSRLRKYSCGVCGKKFAQSWHLRDHMRTHDGMRPFECEKCHKKFSLSAHLSRHMRTHDGVRPFECELCHKKFTQSGHLKDHIARTHDGMRPFECEKCHKKFSLNVHLTRHMRTHDGKRPFECEQCHKMFSQSGHLKEHMTTHEGMRPFECEQCHKKFSLNVLLRRHMRAHDGTRPFECELCHKKFLQRGNLRDHMRTHDGVRPFGCELCHKKFSLSGILTRHMKTHYGDRPFECEQCHKKFSQSGNLRDHMRIHDGMRPFECEQCHKTFSLNAHLKDHMTTHDRKRPFECELCHKKFSQSGHLRDHMRIHDGKRPFECKVCHKKFSQSGNLTRHMRTHD